MRIPQSRLATQDPDPAGVSPLDGARRLVGAGNSVVAVPPDGSKRPRWAWKRYQRRRPTDPQLVAWFGAGHNGPAVVAGAVSRGREVVDFDDAGLFRPWWDAVERRAPGLAGRLTVVRTPRPGYQAHYRCLAVLEGNQPLARAPKSPTPDDPAPFATVIETRGEGGIALTPYCPPGCHPRRRRYELLRGDFDAPALLTAGERSVLLDAARAFNTYTPPRVVTGPPPPRSATGDRPGDHYNARADWRELLGRHGWTPLNRRGGVLMWRRPGKDGGGGSATTNFADSNLLYVFSSNAAPFGPGTSYTIFAAYALLEHGGDFTEAARALAECGYGRPPAGALLTGADGAPARRLPRVVPRPGAALPPAGRSPGLPLDRLQAPLGPPAAGTAGGPP